MEVVHARPPAAGSLESPFVADAEIFLIRAGGRMISSVCDLDKGVYVTGFKRGTDFLVVFLETEIT